MSDASTIEVYSWGSLSEVRANFHCSCLLVKTLFVSVENNSVNAYFERARVAGEGSHSNLVTLEVVDHAAKGAVESA